MNLSISSATGEKRELRGGILSGSKPRVREREKYVTEKKKTSCLEKCAKFSCDSD
jgi:hypothetical protein